MANMALIVGVGNPRTSGWSATPLAGVAADCNNIRRLMNARGLDDSEIKTLMESQATHDTVLAEIERAAGSLSAGDFFLFFYSGHGAQNPGSGGAEEGDGRDEVLLTNGRVIVDDELGERWTLFKTGVRILAMTDCCNSGTNFRYATPVAAAPTQPLLRFGLGKCRSRKPAATRSTRAAERVTDFDIQASLIHIGAARDPEPAIELGAVGGAFTQALIGSLAQDRPRDYNSLHDGINGRLTRQKSQMFLCGPSGAAEAFLQQQPFELGPPGPGGFSPAVGKDIDIWLEELRNRWGNRGS